MASTYDKIATTTLSSAASTVTFSSVSANYTDLVIIADAGEPVGGYFKLQFNGDTSSNYSRTFMYGTGSSAVSNRATTTTSIFINCGASAGAGAAIINIQNYTNSITYKTVIARNNSMTDGLVMANVGLWRNTNAITSIALTGGAGNLASGSIFTVYGIKAA